MKNKPFRAIPQGYEARGPHLYLVPLMAYYAASEYERGSPTEAQWSTMLQRMDYAPHEAEGLAEELSCRYPNPLTLEEWTDFFEQLAAARAMGRKYLGENSGPSTTL